MIPKIKRKMFAVLAGLLFTLVLFAGVMMPVYAAPAVQLTPFPTPTPGLDGRIIYQVQENDTLWRISAVSGVSLDELRQLNSLDVDSVIRPGQVLLLGIVEPPEVTLAPGATQDPATLPTPTPTALADSSAICVLLYLDEDGNAIRDDQEIALADGEVSVTERLGAYSNKDTTEYDNDTDPLCFEGIPPGEYLVTMALPGGFNRTTELSVTVELVPGDTSYLNFGTQPTEVFEPLTEITDPDNGGGGNLLIAVIGAGLLLAGVGVGVWAVINNKRRFSVDEE